MDFLNRWVNAETVMWVAAALSLVLLALHKPVSEIWSSPRRDQSMRMMKIVLFFVLPMLVIIPCLVLLTGQTVEGTSCGFYLLFFLIFWYYLGKNTGLKRGRKDVEELVGLDSFDGVEDAQDRLYESKLRLPTRDAVTDSIKRLSLGQSDEAAPQERRPNRHNTSAIMDVAVEEVEEE